MIRYVTPQKLFIEEEHEEGDFLYGKFSLAPLEKGYAITLGNSLRRVLLSSIMSLAITRIKFPEHFHEFDTIEGIKEDILEMIMNIKRIQLRNEIPIEDEVELSISKDGPGEVLAGDVQCPAGVSVANPDLVIATLNENAHLSVVLSANVGKGYVPVAEQEKSDDIQVIPIDGIYTPVVRVNFHEENVRVGKKTDYDKLVLELWTKRNIQPAEALQLAANILIEHFTILIKNLPEMKGVEMLFETPKDRVDAESSIKSGIDIKKKLAQLEGEDPEGEPTLERFRKKKESAPKTEEKPEDDLSISQFMEEEDLQGVQNSMIVDPFATQPASDEVPQNIEEHSVEDLGLASRTLNCLKREKMYTIGDILSKSKDDLLKIRNFGEKSYQELTEKFQEKYGRPLES